jgi:protein-S-isoprenylcysteine O-methyltransferase Ste14
MVTARGTAYLFYGAATNALFALVALYGIAFIGNVAVPKTVDSGLVVPWPRAVLVDSLLILAFAIQHSGMARVSFKRWSMRIVPAPLERSTYILCASLLLVLLYLLWCPIPATVWTVPEPLLRAGITALFWAGWIVTLLAAAATNQMEMTGLRQILDAVQDRPRRDLTLTTSGLYRIVRHPIYVGTIVAFWATPEMTFGHLLFAVGATAYTLLGTVLEERDLVRIFGDGYRDYRRRIRMLLPFPK